MGFAARPHDKDLTTLAAVRNGSLTRVGSIASVVAIASRYSIQTVLIHRVHRVRQWVAKIFFHKTCGRKVPTRHHHDVASRQSTCMQRWSRASHRPLSEPM